MEYLKKEVHVFLGINALISEIKSSSLENENEEETSFSKYRWDDIQAALIFILLDENCAKADYEKAAEMVWDAALAGKDIQIDLIVGLLYYRLGDSNHPYENNLIWSITSKLKNLDYANTDYNPYIDEIISKKLEEYGLRFG